MFLRFVINRRDEASRRDQGLFTALYALADSGHLSNYERVWFEEQERWFTRHLKRPHGLTQPSAVLWFKASATEHIARMRALSALLQHKDVAVEVLETGKPGYVVYADEHQVAAIPFTRETFQRR